MDLYLLFTFLKAYGSTIEVYCSGKSIGLWSDQEVAGWTALKPYHIVTIGNSFAHVWHFSKQYGIIWYCCWQPAVYSWGSNHRSVHSVAIWCLCHYHFVYLFACLMQYCWMSLFINLFFFHQGIFQLEIKKVTNRLYLCVEIFLWDDLRFIC